MCNIEISKPYTHSDNKIITIDITSISLDGSEVQELFEQLDNDLHYNETREDLLSRIDDLTEQLKELGVEV